MQEYQPSIVKYNELSSKVINKIYQILESQTFNFILNENDGVLTYSVPKVGVYVFNKQPANKQVWSSSPFTGPKRFYVAKDSKWYDTKGDTELKEYVNQEMQKIREKLDSK